MLRVMVVVVLLLFWELRRRGKENVLGKKLPKPKVPKEKKPIRFGRHLGVAVALGLVGSAGWWGYNYYQSGRASAQMVAYDPNWRLGGSFTTLPGDPSRSEEEVVAPVGKYSDQPLINPPDSSWWFTNLSGWIEVRTASGRVWRTGPGDQSPPLILSNSFGDRAKYVRSLESYPIKVVQNWRR